MKKILYNVFIFTIIQNALLIADDNDFFSKGFTSSVGQDEASVNSTKKEPADNKTAEDKNIEDINPQIVDDFTSLELQSVQELSVYLKPQSKNELVENLKEIMEIANNYPNISVRAIYTQEVPSEWLESDEILSLISIGIDFENISPEELQLLQNDIFNGGQSQESLNIVDKMQIKEKSLKDQQKDAKKFEVAAAIFPLKDTVPEEFVHMQRTPAWRFKMNDKQILVDGVVSLRDAAKEAFNAIKPKVEKAK